MPSVIKEQIRLVKAAEGAKIVADFNRKLSETHTLNQTQLRALKAGAQQAAMANDLIVKENLRIAGSYAARIQEQTHT